MEYWKMRAYWIRHDYRRYYWLCSTKIYDFINSSADKGSDDEDAEEKNICDEDEIKSQNSSSDDNNSISTVEVSDDFIFLCYMAFVLWGPFADPKDRLLIFEVGDAPKNSAAMSRAAKKKVELVEKSEDLNSDTQNLRGFTTGQKISIEALIIQEKIQKQQLLESLMVASIALERSLAHQIEAAEKG